MKHVRWAYPLVLVLGAVGLIALGEIPALAAWLFGSAVGFGIGLAAAYYSRYPEG